MQEEDKGPEVGENEHGSGQSGRKWADGLLIRILWPRSGDDVSANLAVSDF